MESESYSNNNNSDMCDSSIDNGHGQNTEDLIFESRFLWNNLCTSTFEFLSF